MALAPAVYPAEGIRAALTFSCAVDAGIAEVGGLGTAGVAGVKVVEIPRFDDDLGGRELAVEIGEIDAAGTATLTSSSSSSAVRALQ